jgi:translation initiation factor IF-3
LKRSLQNYHQKGEPVIKNDDDKVRVNRDIRASQVRLIGSAGEQIGVVPLYQALVQAEEQALDLVEVASQASPPVCKIMNYGKYLFELNKQKHAAKKKQKQIQIKEIKFRPVTEEADYQVKLRNLIRFLEEGDKAKVTLRFRGRELSHQELGMQMLKRVETDLAEHAVVEQAPKLEGKQVFMMLAPKKKK